MKVLLVATVQSHICQFHRPLVAMLHEHGCEVHVAARNNLAEKNGLKLDFVEQVFDVPFQRSPFSPKNLGAYKQLKKIIDEGNYDVVHCNTPVGGVLDGWLHEKPASAAPRSFIPLMASTFIRARRRKTGSSGIRWRSLCAAIRTSSSPSRRRIMTLPRQSFPRRWSAFMVLVQILQSIVSCPKPNARRCGVSLAMLLMISCCFVPENCCRTRTRSRQFTR